MDFDLLKKLQYNMNMCWASTDHEDRAITKFRDSCLENPDVTEEMISLFIQERYPNRETTQVPAPVVVIPSPAPAAVSKQVVSAPQVETFTPTPAQETWVDEVLEEAFPESKTTWKPTAVNHQTTEKTLLTELIHHWFNANSRNIPGRLPQKEKSFYPCYRAR